MSQSGSITLGYIQPDGAPPTGAAGGDLTGNYPNPGVALVGGATAADVAQSTADTQAATDLSTATTLVKRDSHANAQFAAMQMEHVSAGVDNIGIGCNPSVSANFPILTQRNLSTPIVDQLSNPNTGAGTGVKKQVLADAGNNYGELGIFTSATVAPDAYAGGNMTLRCSGSTAGIALIADDSATYIKHYVGGNASTNLALQTKSDLTTISYGGIILSTAGARPTAGVDYRGMLYVQQGAGGVADVLQICLKKADDSYAWLSVTVS